MRIQQLKDDDVGAAEPQVLQALHHPIRIVEQIRDQDREASLAERVGELVERTPHVGLRARDNPFEREQDRVHVARPRARRQPGRDLLVELDEPRRVALPVHQVGERRREHAAVFELAHRRAAAIRHRGAHVEQQVAFEVGFLLELLDVVAIGARVDFPVERGQVVARQVLPVFRELDAEPFVGTAVQPREEPFHHRTRLQLHRPEPPDDGGVEKADIAAGRGGRHGYIPLRGAGTASISLSTRMSDVTFSDSA